MHIEKNVCDKILGTLLNIGGKSKDHLEAHFDLQEQNIRKDLHPVLSAHGQSYEIKAAIFDMSKKEKEIFCSVLKNVKLPYGFASNISRYVSLSEIKVVGYKSHDAHFMLHYMLQFAMRRTLKPEVALPLIKLGAFLRGLWGKVIKVDDLNKLQKEIVDVLCRFEMIFVQSLFDIMIHLLVHLCREVEYGGLVHVRCMFPIERYLGKLKSYVRNRSKPEGSIAESYLAEEYVTFCSSFLGGEGEIEDTMHPADSARNANLEYHIGTKKNKDGKVFKMKHADWKVSHRYVLFNSGNNEVQGLIEEHRVLLDGEANTRKYKRERTHTNEFLTWLKEEVLKNDTIFRDLEVFALGPNRSARRFNGYVVNGFRFHTKSRDSRCTTQNSGIFLTAETTSFASSKDENPIVGNANYYGSVEDIFELDYWGVFNVVLFKCYWYQEEKDEYGLTKVNFNRLSHKDDPYVLSSQVQQVYYVEDPIQKMVHYVIKKLPMDVCDADNENAVEEKIRNPNFDDIDINPGIEIEVGDDNCFRDDVPQTKNFVL